MLDHFTTESKNTETLYSLILEYINLPLLSKREPEILETLLQIFLHESDLESLRETADMMGEILCDEKEELDVKSKLLDLIFSYLIEKLGIPFIHMFETESFRNFFNSCDEKDNLLYFGAQKLIQAALQPIFLKYNGVDLSKILPDLSSRGEAELRDPDRNDIFENMYCNICLFLLNPNSLLSQNPQETLRNAELAISQRIQTRYRREFLLELLQKLKMILSQNAVKTNISNSQLTTENIHHGHHFAVRETLPQISIDFDYIQLQPNQYKLTPEQSQELGVVLCEMLNLKTGGTILLGVTENMITGLEITKRQREILLEDIEDVINRLRPVTASNRISMEYIQLKGVESITEKMSEKFVLKITVERSYQHDFENNPFRLIASKGGSEKDWNMSQIHFRQHVNDPEPQLNLKEIVRYAAVEEYYRGVENLQINANHIIQPSSKHGASAKGSRKGHVCQIFVKTALTGNSQGQMRLLWKYLNDDTEEEIEFSQYGDSGTAIQTKYPIRVLKGQIINFKLEEYSESQRNSEKGFREYEAQHQKVILEIPSMNDRFIEKFEEKIKKEENRNKDEKEEEYLINLASNGIQLTSQLSRDDSQSISSTLGNKDIAGNTGASELTAITKRKPTPTNDQKPTGYSKMTVLIEGIEALGKPPVTKQDLHKLFKPFNVDYNNIVVKNSKDCAFVEVNPDKWAEFKKTYEAMGLLISKRETKDDTLSYNQNLKNTYIGGFEKYVILRQLKAFQVNVSVDDVKTNFNGNICRIFVQIKPEDWGKIQKLAEENNLRATIWKKRNAWIGGFNLLIDLPNSAHVTDEETQKVKMKQAFLDCLGKYLVSGEIEPNDIKRDQYGYYYAFLDVRQEDWEIFKEKAEERGLRVNNQIDR